MSPTKQKLLEESGHGTSTGYGNYNTYGTDSYDSHTAGKANPFATNAGYAYSPAPVRQNPALRASQLVLAGSALFFVLAIGLGFATNVETAQRVGHFDAGSAISAGICSILVALMLYGTVGYLMQRRLNNGRMLGVAFALIGVIMGLISAVVCFVTATGALSIIAGICYLAVVALNIVWLVQANQPKLYRSLRM